MIEKLYVPPDMNLWQGRVDAVPGEYFYQIIKPLDLRQTLQNSKNKFALLGFACDAGVARNLGRRGAVDGPNQMKKALGRLPVHRALEVYDAGMIVCEGDALEEAQQALGQAVAKLLAGGFFPIVIGGGHETAWGHYQGLDQYYRKAIPTFNFDAHFDLRDILPGDKGSSGTPFHQIAKLCDQNGEAFEYSCLGIQPYGNTKSLFERAQQLGVQYLLAEDIFLKGQDCALQFTEDALARASNLYVTLCLDVLSSAYVPGVSAPQALGLMPWHVLASLRKLAESGKMVSLDLVEYAPCYDVDDRTAKLGALFISDFLQHVKI